MTEDSNNVCGIKCPEGFFKGVKYFLIGNIDDTVKQLLSDGGASEERYMSETITHAIADDCEADDYSEAKELFELTVVTSRWVVLSVKCGALLPINGFMPEKDQLFSGITICPSGLTETDAKHIWGITSFHGGSCQVKLDQNVTHLVCNKAAGAKYDAAMSRSEIKIVCPDWIFECVKNKSKIDEEIYHPRLLNVTPPPPPAPRTPTPEPQPAPEQLVSAAGGPLQFTPKLEPKLEPGTPPGSMPPHHHHFSAISQQHQQQHHFHGYPPHHFAAPPYAAQAGLPAPQPRPPNLNLQQQQQQQQVQQQMLQQMMIDQAGGLGLKGESARTKEALARMVSNRLHGRMPGSPEGIRPMMPGSPGGSGSRPTSPRAHLRNITNNEPKSPRSKMTQLVNSLNRSPRPMSPGRSALSAQLQQLAANRVAYTAAQKPEVPVFFGHDPIETVPEDLCLLGCVFFVTDYQRYLSPDQINTWKRVIEQHGGQVDDSYSNRVTHLLCETQQSDVFVMAQRDHKRLVTAYWLNDVLLRKKMTPPWLALHYPSLYGSNKPCANQIICVTNFEGEERQRIKNMISVLGAKYTGYMTHANSVLIAKRKDGLKYRKALEWRIAVLNVQWLTDLMLGHLDALKLPPQSKYQQFGSEDDFKVELWRVGHLLEGWRTPLRIPKDAWKKFGPSELIRRNSLEGHGIKRKASDSDNMTENKRPRMYPPPPLPPHSEGTPIVVMTGIPKPKAELLAQAVRRLGGLVSEHPRHCTHLVTNNVSRTVKFLCALNVAKYIVTPYWIEQSALENKFLDVNNFVLRDIKSEKQFSFNLELSLKRSQERPLFKGLKFYLTPSVVPPFSILQQIIESAGGIVVKKRPSIRSISSHRNINGEPTFAVITTEDDLHLSQDLFERHIAVHNVEFILTGIMQQKVDFKAYEIHHFTKMK